MDDDGTMSDIEIAIDSLDGAIYGDHGKIVDLSDEDYDALWALVSNLQCDLTAYSWAKQKRVR